MLIHNAHVSYYMQDPSDAQILFGSQAGLDSTLHLVPIPTPEL